MSKLSYEAIIQKTPTFILTCDKKKEQSDECFERLKGYGFSNIEKIIGDHDPRIGDKKKMHRQNSSFVSLCLEMVEKDIKYAFIFEEDAEINKKREKNYIKTIEWAFKEKVDWDIIYGGCAALNPVYINIFTVDGARVAYSNKGQGGGHAMLIKKKTAKMFLDKAGPDFETSFDIVFQKMNLKCYTPYLPAWYQNVNPKSMTEYNLQKIGDHQFWQDFSFMFWVILPFVIIAFLVLAILVSKYKKS